MTIGDGLAIAGQCAVAVAFIWLIAIIITKG